MSVRSGDSVLVGGDEGGWEGWGDGAGVTYSMYSKQ